VVIDGDGSQWNLSGNFYIGGNANAPAGAGTLRIANGNYQNASVNASATMVWSPGTIEMGGGAAINGTLTFEGGRLRALTGIRFINDLTIGTGGMIVDSNSFDTTLQGTLSGSGALTKMGPGTLYLERENTYTGGTTVTGGRLLVENPPGAVTGTGTGLLRASGPGVVVGGSGAIGSPVIIEDDAVLLVGDARGPAGSKTLILSNDLELNSTLEIQLSFFNTHSTLQRTGGDWSFAPNQKVAFVTSSAAQPGLYSHVITGLAADPGVESWSMVGSGFSGNFTYDGAGNVDLHLTSMPPYLGLQTAMLRKTHGAAGVFNVNIPLGGPVGIEPRAGGFGGNHTYVLTFSNPVVSGSFTVDGLSGERLNGSPIFNGNTVTVNVANIQPTAYIILSVSNVTDIYSQTMEDAYVDVQFLEGDATRNGRVNSSDVSQVKSQSGQTVTGSNFLNDLNADGEVDASDVSLVKSRSGSASH
jgi:autotransporter-associated beta strand protein/T5SS/PEP-CTERM-associated repeat protein